MGLGGGKRLRYDRSKVETMVFVMHVIMGDRTARRQNGITINGNMIFSTLPILSEATNCEPTESFFLISFVLFHFARFIRVAVSVHGTSKSLTSQVAGRRSPRRTMTFIIEAPLKNTSDRSGRAN